MSYLALAKRARPLTPDQRTRGAAILRALADELERAGAGRTQQALGAAADFCYPSTAGGSGNGGAGGSGLTPVEAKASSFDRPAADAIRLLLELQQVVVLADRCQLALQGWRPDRPLELYPDCGHPVDRNYRRCQVMVDGRQCGAGMTERRCDTCRRPLGPGEKLRRQVALDQGGAEVMECDTCRKARKDSGGRTRRVTVETLALDVGEAEAERLMAEQVMIEPGDAWVQPDDSMANMA